MIEIVRTDAANPDFIQLVSFLDADLEKRDGEDHSFYAPFNRIDQLKGVAMAYENSQPVGCGAMKEWDQSTVEIKRMYTLPGSRGKGIATMILKELEQWASELSFKRCQLETGIKQPEAIGLYSKNSYRKISNYGQYAGIENSVCFEKEIF